MKYLGFTINVFVGCRIRAMNILDMWVIKLANYNKNKKNIVTEIKFIVCTSERLTTPATWTAYFI